MSEPLSDGTMMWLGGMDTSRPPTDIEPSQYSKAVNVIIPDNLGGIRARFGFHHVYLHFEDSFAQKTYQSGHVQGEGWFEVSGRTYLIVVVDGYVFRLTPRTQASYYAVIINVNDPNNMNIGTAWVNQVPNGVIVNNGYDFPIYVTEDGQRRTDPTKGEIGIGRMGVYVQNRYFQVDESGKQIIAGDFRSPITVKEIQDTNIFGFMAPDADEEIIAIGKQKTILTYVEGGNLIFSTNKDIYAADVRGDRSAWGNVSLGIGKVNETIPGFAATSAYSFESFNANVYFRSAQYGMCDLRQSESQFSSLDASSNQSIEASYFFNNDTDWMLNRCYTRACNQRLFTTVTPERTEKGYIFWNGIVSYYPSSLYKDKTLTPRRYESVFTGVRPWCLTVVRAASKRDQMFIHSHDEDGVNRMYVMREDTDFDTNQYDQTVEIEGFIETRAYQFNNPFLLKKNLRRFYQLGEMARSVTLSVSSRPESSGEWVTFWNVDHKICEVTFEDLFLNSKPQSRPFVNLGSEKFGGCHRGESFFSIQYRIEFKGPISLERMIAVSSSDAFEKTNFKKEENCTVLNYSYRKDYSYSISTPKIT